MKKNFLTLIYLLDVEGSLWDFTMQDGKDYSL